MRLSRLECYGFKSFADKIRIDFDTGLTAIVGPNGCGKSNVADAVRWVLGESSMRVLRGERLDDVIFKGTRDRKPLSVAEVTLSFAGVRDTLNVDYEDLAITRRVFRDGVSDFLINKVPCRLKDITDLFLDTGVGKDAYSVLEFKMVEQLISNNPAERRLLFEQAAGIMRYRDRLKASERRLAEAEGNLERLGDIVAEVEKNVRSLAYQVRKARRYRRLRAQIVRLELHTAQSRWNEYARRLDELAGREKERIDAVAAEQVAMGQADAELESRRTATDGQSQELREAELELSQLRARVASLEREGVVNRERRKGLEATRERARAEIEELRATGIEVAASREAHDARLAELAEPLEAARARTEKGDEAVRERRENEERIHAEVETLRAEVMSRVEARERLATKESAHMARVEALEEQRRAELARGEGATETRVKAEERIGEIERSLDLAREREAVAEESLHTLAEREGALQEEAERFRAGVEDLRGKRDAAQARLGVLRDLEAKLEGYGRAVRELIGDGAEANGVEGVLATALRVVEGHETAIEAVLSDRLQAVLTSDEGAARSALARVRDGDWGRVALLPRSLAGRNRVASAARSDSGTGDGIVGPALEQIEALDQRAEDAIRGLLDRVLIVRDLDVAMRRLGADADPGWTYVTRGGEVVAPGGMIIGGREGDGSAGSLLSRRREIESADELADRLRRALEEARGEAGRVTDELRELKAATGQTRAQTDAARREVHQLEVEANRCRERLRAAQVEIERSEAAIAQCDESAGALRREAESIGGALLETDAHRDERSNALSEGQNALKDARQARQMIEEEVSAGRLSVARLDAEIKNIEAAEARERQRIEEMEARSERLEAEVRDAATAIEELASEAKRIDADLEGALDEEKGVAAGTEELRAVVNEVREELRALESKARDARRRHDAAREELHEIEMDTVELRTNQKALRENIQQNHRVDLVDASAVDAAEHEAEDESASMGESDDTETPADPSEFDDLEDPEARLEELRLSLDRLGQVNVLAIEQHDEEKKRLDFLIEQRQDLFDARDGLQETIDRINKAARDAFSETFAQIREHFRELFATLFRDGDADVFLEEDVDPLDARIDIIARPGGKRPQKLSLLSSGEKTMTAIALLFALFRVRPSPFCLLDEIDAPLDDANILRFVTLLDKFADETQFLVITHNKRTMEGAGAIFGITMEELGVSKILSLKIDDHRKVDDSALASLKGVSGASLES